MSDLTLELIKLISQGKTVNEISKKLQLSNRQIYNMLTLIKNKGFDFERKYYYNGDIIYVPKKKVNQVQNEGISIITEPSDKTFRAILISDLHMGSRYERLDLLNKIYDYCIKENIHIIINGGDVIDGMIGNKNKKHDNIIQQVDYAFRNYPFDKSILNFTVLGNHDIDSLHKVGQDFAEVLKNYRHDIVPLGYEEGQINIKNSKIFVQHPLFIEKVNRVPKKECLILKGHYHKMKLNTYSNKIVINIPSLSDIKFSDNEFLPGAIEMELKFNNGFITLGNFKHMLIDKKIHIINEIQLNFHYKTGDLQNLKIKNEEVREKVYTL